MYLCTIPLSVQGDTLENVSAELKCVMKTGVFSFTCSEDPRMIRLVLQYEPSASTRRAKLLRQDSSSPAEEGAEVHGNVLSETWEIDQISDFGHKLGLLDARKKEGNESQDDEGLEDDQAKEDLVEEDVVEEYLVEEERVQHFHHLNEVLACITC